MLSTIICTYNRDKFIAQALQSLAQQSLNETQYEVIVVNNNCTDNTSTIVNDFIAANPELDIKQVFEHNQGLSFARNRGIREAKYDIITYMDDDGVAEKTYLEKIVSYFEQHPNVVGIGGKVIPIYE
ncbi:MAG: glycosyltransferase family A protein, partial [Bacteroidota bacterium]